jgi:hypothetical protein
MEKPAAETILEVERRLAGELGLGRGQVVLDFPAKPTMLATDVLVRCADGRVLNASRLGPEEGFAINAAQAALYVSSGTVSLFTAEPRRVDPERVLALVREVASAAPPRAPGVDGSRRTA